MRPRPLINCTRSPAVIERLGAISQAQLARILGGAPWVIWCWGLKPPVMTPLSPWWIKNGQIAAIETVSQYEVHSEFGGVYPELASRAHLEAILPTIETVMTRAGVGRLDLRAIGVTRGPGLMGSLLVGVSTAQALSMAWALPCYGVNHLRGHIRSVDLEEKRLTYPALVMLVSGGHTLLAYLEDQHSYELLGTTRDDSVGECYDKVARTLGLGMPGGPAIDRRAACGTASIKFPRPMIQSGYEFSFSGLKSSVARHVETSSRLCDR